MEYQYVAQYFVDGSGVMRKAAPFPFFRLALGDTLLIKGANDIHNVRTAAYAYATRHHVRLMVHQVAADTVRVSCMAQDAVKVQYGQRGGGPVGPEALRVDGLAEGESVVLPWRVDAHGLRVEQGGLTQMIRRAIIRGERKGKAFYSQPLAQGVEVRRIR